MSFWEPLVAGTDVVWLLWEVGNNCQCFAANTKCQCKGNTDRREVSRDEKANLQFPTSILKAGGPLSTKRCGDCPTSPVRTLVFHMMDECNLLDAIAYAFITVCS